MLWMILALSTLNAVVAVALCVLIVTVRRQTGQLEQLRHDLTKAFEMVVRAAGGGGAGPELSPGEDTDDDRRDRR